LDITGFFWTEVISINHHINLTLDNKGLQILIASCALLEAQFHI